MHETQKQINFLEIDIPFHFEQGFSGYPVLISTARQLSSANLMKGKLKHWGSLQDTFSI